MKKLVILLLCGAFALSCTDKAYDLSQIETGDVAIGNDDSEFRMPLMTVLVPMADLAADGKEIPRPSSTRPTSGCRPLRRP